MSEVEWNNNAFKMNLRIYRTNNITEESCKFFSADILVTNGFTTIQLKSTPQYYSFPAIPSFYPSYDTNWMPIITCDAALLKYILMRWRHVERDQRSCKKRTLIIFYMQRISSPISRPIFSSESAIAHARKFEASSCVYVRKCIRRMLLLVCLLSLLNYNYTSSCIRQREREEGGGERESGYRPLLLN